MRSLFLISIFGAAMTAPAFAQPTMPAPATPTMTKTFTSSAEVQQLIAKAKADRKGDAPTTIEPILALGTYHANLEYRPIAGPAALHETENEVMYVIEGSATITMGGQMVNPTRPNPTNQSAASISGGSDTAVGKGDFIMVPHGTPHQITAVKDGPLVLMTLHMPQ